MGSMVFSFSESAAAEALQLGDDKFSVPHITLRQLIYFAAAAQNESALRAAESLNVSPPAISGAIASLEAILDKQLFIRRHARGLVLTEAGQHLLAEARDIIGRVKEIELTRLNRAGQPRTRINFGCLGDIAPAIVPRLVRIFKDRYPNAEIRWHTDEHSHLMQRLEDGNLDLIFVLDFEILPELHSTLLQAAPALCVLPEHHHLSDGTVSLRDLAREPFIMLDMPRTRDYFMSIFGDFGLQPDIAVRAPSAAMVRSLVANGFGYSLLNFSTLGCEGIVYRPLEGHTRPSHLVAVRQHRRRPSKILDEFVSEARNILHQNQRGDVTPY